MPLEAGSTGDRTATLANRNGVTTRGVLLGILGGGVPPGSPNPDPISDQKMPLFTHVFRPGLYNPYPFSDLRSYVIIT